ncbi:ParB/RepB/Spo0J family partition protein [Paraflavisolibacter sp. H34]|uniref:ParB/RepB/Spo0J family partition protein n=1 Tax=Huijunlia imazamoxiresistens TaxID=3127457 RepID=UPI0030163FAA
MTKKKTSPRNEKSLGTAATGSASVLEIPETSYTKVPVGNIFPDPNQPRKYFNEADLKELADSVRGHGVLQAITVRPFPDDIPLPKEARSLAGPVFLLVIGERRLRAARAAGILHIPTVIRSLSNAEALEIQIIENLLRKDILPMEEAVAFASLKERYSIEEIALRVGKSPQFVANRVKLNDLVPAFQDLLAAEKIKLTDAVNLSRFAGDAQQEILKSLNVPDDWQERPDWQPGNLAYYIDRQQHNLDSAPFPIEDPDLYPEMGACSLCPHNSACNQLLFPDMNTARTCHNGVCFKIKCSRNYKRQLEEHLKEPDMLFVTKSYYLDDDAKAKVRSAEEMGAAVLNRDTFTEIRPPEHPGSWEDYLKENDRWSEEEEYSEEENREAEQQCKQEWESEVADYEHELEHYNRQQQSGNLRRALVVAGTEEGRIIEVVFTPQKGVPLPATEGNRELACDLEIKRMEQREERNQELDREKVYKRASAELKHCAAFIDSTAPIAGQELVALTVLLSLSGTGAGPGTKDWLEKQLGAEHDYRGLALFEKLRELPEPGLMYRFIRRSVFDGLDSTVETDWKKYGKAAALYELMKIYLPGQLAAYQKEQDEKTLKRQANVQVRIDARKKEKQLLRAGSPEEEKQPQVQMAEQS